MMDLIRMLLPWLQRDVNFCVEKSKKRNNRLLRIELLDLVKVKCNFHYCRSGEHKHVALRIRNADTQCTICRRLQFYAVLEIVIYKED